MLQISHGLLSRIWRHGEAQYPEEGAGLLLGRIDDEGRMAEQLLPLENKFQREARGNRYLIEPIDMLDAEQQAEELGLDVIGVFHSHPDHSAKPSEYDREWSLPWFSYLITSVYVGKALESRSWRLTENRSALIEEALRICFPATVEDTE